MQNKILLSKIVFFAIFFIPFLVFFLLFQSFALNIPCEDDYGILRNLYDISTKNNFNEQFAIFISPSNEHPIIISKVFFGLDNWLFKTINFKALMFVGNAFFLSSFLVFFQLIKQHKSPYWILLPLPYILLSAYIFESGLWAICSFQYNAIFGFFCWAIFFIFAMTPSKPKFYLGLALLSCVLVCNGNGILSFVVVGIGLIYQKRWQNVLILLGLLLLLKFMFLSNNYYKNPNDILTVFSSFSVLVGGSFKTDSLNTIVKIIGFLIMFFIAFSSISYLLKQQKDIFKLNILFLGLFCLGSLLGVALFRDVSSSSFPDRYRLYPQFLLVCVYFLLIIKFPFQRRRLTLFTTIFSIFYFSYSYYVTYSAILNGYQKRLLSSVNLAHNGSTLNGSFYRPLFDQTIKFYRKSKKYDFEKPIFELKNVCITTKKIKANVEKVEDGFIFRAEGIESEAIVKEKGYYLSLENPKHQFYFLPLFHTRNSLAKISMGNPFFTYDVSAVIPNAEIPANTYKISLVSTIETQPRLLQTDIIITTKQVGYNQ